MECLLKFLDLGFTEIMKEAGDTIPVTGFWILLKEKLGEKLEEKHKAKCHHCVSSGRLTGNKNARTGELVESGSNESREGRNKRCPAWADWSSQAADSPMSPGGLEKGEGGLLLILHVTYEKLQYEKQSRLDKRKSQTMSRQRIEWGYWVWDGLDTLSPVWRAPRIHKDQGQSVTPRFLFPLFSYSW